MLKKWHFGIDNDNFVNLVLSGDKRATSSLFDGDFDHISIGEKEILIYDNEKEACITQTKKIIIQKFKEVGDDIAFLEGEGDKSLEYWRKVHYDFFKTDANFSEESFVITEIFEVIENLKESRLKLAKEIIEQNQNIFGNVKHIEEINAGFNNTLFNVDDKYVLKICGNGEKKEFDIEANFYKLNQSNKHIAILYKYDGENVPPYEILEKIQGDTMYYHWYKMNEIQRKNTIKNIVEVIKDFHKKRYGEYDWCKKIKDFVLSNYDKTKELFTAEEREIIEESLKYYEDILVDNRFVLSHNDLHFDNIILTDDNEIKIIDFNDSEITPLDYDLRLLFFSKDEPWKWANSEMDPLQKLEDYKHIVEYIKEYYTELNDIKFLDERMLIYKVKNDISHLERFKLQELKTNIVKNSTSIVNRMKKIK